METKHNAQTQRMRTTSNGVTMGSLNKQLYTLVYHTDVHQCDTYVSHSGSIAIDHIHIKMVRT